MKGHENKGLSSLRTSQIVLESETFKQKYFIIDLN